ncbi:MAG: BatA domain-containing protein [Phycisphaerae bacterium]|nr:BatA domain-containing protein [Phycisphaerae bacterium]
MPFMHPAIFWAGVGAMGVPVVIHILNRTRYRMRDWAAMRFLLEAMKKNRRRLRLEELILLALRMLIVLALGVALGRLTGCAAMTSLPLGGTEPAAVVFVIDDSFSMGQQVADGSLYDAAVGELAEQIRALPEGSRVAVVRASTQDTGRLARLRTVEDPASVAEQLRAGGLSDMPADLADALDRAHTLLEDASGRRRCYVLSDCRHGDWVPEDRAAKLRSRLEAIQGDGIDVVVADYGRAATANLTVEAVSRRQADRDKLVLAGEPVNVRVQVRNNSEVVAGAATIRLTARRPDEPWRQAAPAAELDTLEPGAPAVRVFKVTPARPGPLVLRAEVPRDELAGDNAALLALDVREAIRVLVVDDRKGAAPRERPSRLLVEALRPGDMNFGVQADLVTSTELAVQDLSEYDAVVLVDVARLVGGTASRPGVNEGSPSSLAALEAFVRGGGGLALFTGDRVDTRYYNEHLYAGGAGLLPYPIAPRAGDGDDEASYVRLDVRDTQRTRAAGDWLRRWTKGAEFDLTTLIRVRAFTPVKVPEAGEQRSVVLARFTDADASPAVVLHPFGEGRVVSVFTSADLSWTDWARYGFSYAPMIQDMVRFLVRPQDDGRNERVGEPVVYDVPRRLRRAQAVLERFGPDGSVTLARWLRIDKRLEHAADRAGGYALGFAAGGLDMASVAFARNVAPSEGDLTPAGGEAVRDAGGDDVIYTARDATGSPEALVRAPDKPYWKWVLAAMLGLLAVETVLARRFGHYG